MITQELEEPPRSVGALLPPAPRGHVSARIGLRVELQTTQPGVVQLNAASDHRLKIHAGAPVRGRCRSQAFRYTRGDIDVFPAGVSDTWHEDDPSTCVILQLSPSLLRVAAQDLGADPDVAGLELRCQIRDPQIEHIGWALNAERAAGYPGGRLYVETLSSALAIHLVGRYPAPLRVGRGLSKPQLRRVTHYIEEHLDQDLSLRRLAEVAAVSTSHFKNLFKRSTGVAVHEYVIQRRVERAKALLMRGASPASQIALETGFSHQSHLARAMRRVLGVTPTALARRS